MEPSGGLGSKPAWSESTDGLFTLHVFRDGLVALLVIFCLHYMYNYLYNSSGSSPTDMHPLTSKSLAHFFPTPPSPLILNTCTRHLASALAVMKQYGVHPRRGFLPARDPCTRLTNVQCEEWEWLGTQLPDLLSAGQCRQVLSTMKLVNWRCVGKSRAQRRRAFLLLSAMANAYLWCEPDNIVDTIPKNIAIPLCGIAEALGMQPALVHASIVLANWRRLDPKGPVTTDNITTLLDILGGRDEKWFFLLTVEIEYVGAPALLPCLLLGDAAKELQQILSKNSITEITTEAATINTSEETIELACAWMQHCVTLLDRMRKSIKEMTTSFQKMSKQCDPYIFYHRVRPFLSGTKGNPTLPNGVIYEGVYNNEHRQCSGGSAAQSTLLPIFDSALGIKHEGSDFIREMREYMPKEHREFIVHVHTAATDNTLAGEGEGEGEGEVEGDGREDKSIAHIFQMFESARGNELLATSGMQHHIKTMTVAYNKCVLALTTFRNTHVRFYKELILNAELNIHA